MIIERSEKMGLTDGVVSRDVEEFDDDELEDDEDEDQDFDDEDEEEEEEFSD